MTTGSDESNLSTLPDSLTPSQIENWRKVLLGLVGPYALIMPDEEVEQIRATIQSQLSDEKTQT